MSASGGQTSSKTLTTGSMTGGSQGGSGSGRAGALPLRRRRTKVTNEKKIADDEFMAAAIGDVEWLKQSLREVGSQIVFDKNGLAALHLAAIHGRLECIKLCIEKFKQDVNLASSTGWRPVHLCISNQTGKRSLQCLAYLLEKGADSSIANDDGITPVHQAASEGHVQCLKFLIEVGAKIEGKDCRGNTPLDLAKLWGHRKCARILAAEMWHQDKNNVAQEMRQLKKLKMQQVLRELEEEAEAQAAHQILAAEMWHQDKNNVAQEMRQLKKLKMQQVLRELEEEAEAQAAHQFYGQQAYDQWLSTHGFSVTKTGLLKTDSPKAHTKLGKKPTVTIREPLMKPNSMAVRGPQEVAAESGAITMSVSVGKKVSTSSKPSRLDTATTMMSELDAGLYGHGEQREPSAKVEARTLSPDYYNPNKWNFSSKTPSKDYVPILKDDYPRDEYTLMPKTGDAKYFDGKHANEESDSGEKKVGAAEKNLRKPNLPQEVIEREMSKDPSLYDRPILFKPRHIDDVHKKKKYAREDKPLSEAPLHLCDDVTSELVKLSVLFNPHSEKLSLRHRKSAGKALRQTSGNSESSHPDGASYTCPLPELLTTLKLMQKPDHYPSIRGKEYDIRMDNVVVH